MKEIFEEEETDAVLFVDASNAFNSINRKAMLHNIQYLCPSMATYVKNCYGKPSRLFVAGGKEIESAEGSTQGDPTAMQAYGVGILPMLTIIKPEVQPKKMKHVAYADDLGGGSTLNKVRKWWEKIVEYGLKFGYFPKASKSWLVVKEERLEEAKELFKGAGINITTEGRKYLGGYIGTDEGKKKYVQELVDEWKSQIEKLSDIARSEPQAAYSAFTAGFKHKLTYFMRTIPDISEILRPVDEVINTKFIPAITERAAISERDRNLLALPVKLGGLGIPIFSESCIIEYKNSRGASENLTSKIVSQDEDYIADKKKERATAGSQKTKKVELNKKKLEHLRSTMTKQQIRGNDLAQMKGASAWLTSLPLKDEGYVLNKREFFDALALRYRWRLKYLPTHCACGQPFNMDHAMQCKKGGYIHRRHDRMRDLFAKLMADVVHDVQIEPRLQPLTGESLPPGSNEEDEARLDFTGRGFWQEYEMAFFDVKVFSPFAKSHNKSSSLESVFTKIEEEKKTKYNSRVTSIEHGSFTPVVMSSFGGFGRETSRFISKLVEKTAEKQGSEQSAVANYIRSKVSFELIPSQIACIRGSRKRRNMNIELEEAEVVENVSRIKESLS